MNYVKSKYNLLIPISTAEDIKITYASLGLNENTEVNLKGQDLLSGLPKILNISSGEINEAIKFFILTRDYKNMESELFVSEFIIIKVSAIVSFSSIFSK